MMDTIFGILGVIIFVLFFMIALLMLGLDLKDGLRKEAYKKDRLNDSILYIIEYAEELEKYIPSDDLSEDDEEYIRSLQEAIKDQLYFMDKLFKRGF